MLIETFLSRYMRYSACRLLSFSPGSGPVLPRQTHGKARLLYVHVPFCEHLCPYCSFNRVEYEPSLATRYFGSLRREIEMYKRLGFHFDSVYVGGGTPTVMPDELAKVLDLIRSMWPIGQISTETNPNHLTPDIIATLKNAGVNRLSVGVQSFDDEILAKIGRLRQYGSGKDIQQRLSSLPGVFDTLNVDLIFSLPGQTRASVLNDIETVKKLNIDQATFYPLMSSDVAKAQLQADVGKIDRRKEAKMYKDILEQMSESYRPASAWCFSRNEGMIDEYVVSHDEYAGLGSGAFGYIDGAVYSNTFSVQRYIELVESGVLPLSASRRFARPERIGYDFLMKLFGGSLNLADMTRKHGNLVWFDLCRTIIFLSTTGAGALRNGHLFLTPRGQYYLVVLMREFFAGVNNLRQTCAETDNSRYGRACPTLRKFFRQ